MQDSLSKTYKLFALSFGSSCLAWLQPHTIPQSTRRYAQAPPSAARKAITFAFQPLDDLDPLLLLVLPHLETLNILNGSYLGMAEKWRQVSGCSPGLRP